MVSLDGQRFAARREKQRDKSAGCAGYISAFHVPAAPRPGTPMHLTVSGYHLYFYNRERVLHPLYNRLYLPALQGLLQGVLYEPGTGNHGGGLFYRVVLAKGDKVDVLHVE